MRKRNLYQIINIFLILKYPLATKQYTVLLLPNSQMNLEPRVSCASHNSLLFDSLFFTSKKEVSKNDTSFFGAEGETRTLAPVTRPTPLAGAPRHQLEYFCIGSVYDTIRLLKERAENPLSLLSGGESGIRTHGTLPYDGFQDRSVITTSVSLRIRRKL